MPKVMLINVTHSEESRVAIVHEGLLESFEIESQSRAYLKGNIYKGVIHRIHPALEAAFVDIGADRDAFLPLDEICFRNLPSPPPSPTRSEDDGARRKLRIREVLRPGQELLVQIVKEQFANKPPTVTTFYSLPGRYLVLLPGTDDVGISRRIEGDERVRLRKLVDELSLPEGQGLIVRTVAGLEDAGRELALDLEYLQRLWDNIQSDAHDKGPRSLVYREHDIVLRTIRDFYTPDIDDIYIDDEEVYERARNFLDTVMPSARAALHLYQGEQPIFSAFNLEAQIETVFKRRVPLRSGGSIVIDTTEALTAVDVNSGGSVRGANPEETAFRTNREAAREVARQLRLRDIGGLIVVDFIDMRESRHIQEIEGAMREEMHVDKARHEVGRISGFGLMQISRQRLRPAATTSTYTSCPMCDGHGTVRTTESAALAALRKIHNRISLGDVESMRVALPVAVSTYLLNQKRDELARLESRYQCNVDVQLRADLMPHQMELEVQERGADAAVVVPPARRAKQQAPAVAKANGDTSVAATKATAGGATATPANGPAANANGQASGKRKRRRRGRRRGRGEAAAAPSAEGASANGHDTSVEHGAELTAADAAPAREEASAAHPDASPNPAAALGGPAAAPKSEAPPAGQASAAEQRSGGRRRRGRGRRGGTARAAQVTEASPDASPPSNSTAAPSAAAQEAPAMARESTRADGEAKAVPPAPEASESASSGAVDARAGAAAATTEVPVADAPKSAPKRRAATRKKKAETGATTKPARKKKSTTASTTKKTTRKTTSKARARTTKKAAASSAATAAADD